MKINSNKEKCLEMWKWLADNPEKGKPDYMNYLYTQGRSLEYRSCWACKEANERSRGNTAAQCNNCPIAWDPTDEVRPTCFSLHSPYRAWEVGNESKPQNISVKHKAAVAIIHLINTTWKE